MTTVAALPHLQTANLEWQLKAACRGMDPERFYLPEKIRGSHKRSHEAAAKAICLVCPVMAACLNWAVSVGEPYGVWGGTTPEERDQASAVPQQTA
jgi:WhiB family redox-sensing transcriptional regulator